MSAAAHELTAAQEQRMAAEHASRYDSNAPSRRERCAPGASAKLADPCWTSLRNPTERHLDEAAEHRRRAAEHRAASQALRDAERRACAGLPEQDRDQSPFDQRDDIASVEPLWVGSGPRYGGGGPAAGHEPAQRVEGAVVTFRAVQGMTTQWLQRVIDCHLARNAALGNDVPEMPYCPLVPKGVTASVSAIPAGFAVTIHSDDSASAEEVWRRAQALVAPRGR